MSLTENENSIQLGIPLMENRNFIKENIKN